MYCTFIVITMAFLILKISPENLNLSTSYNSFLNFSNKHMNISNLNDMKYSNESKFEILENTFRRNINILKLHTKLDIVFLIDASSSVGINNFKSEFKFVKKLLSDITVDSNHTRIAIVTFSSPSNIIKNVDEISQSSKEETKCLLLNRQLKNINYSGGETFTVGAFQIAKEIFDNASRNNSKKVLFLITDGYSSGGDPVPVADKLKNKHVTVFTIGIESGNYKELYELSFSGGESYSYILDSFKELNSLARRALHTDLRNGEYIPIGENQPCNILCSESDCCDSKALCTCGTTTGHYACICQKGYYGSGLKNSCIPCTSGTYSDGPNQCLPCPDTHHITVWPAYGLESCKCKDGYRTTENNGCTVLKCPNISLPEHGYFVKKRECINVFNSACGIRCEVGYTLVGSSIRLCQLNASWSGNEPTCEVKTCPQLSVPKFGKIKCKHADLDREYNRNYKQLPVDTVCTFECEKGRVLIGSKKRTCLPLSTWDGLKTSCKAIKCNKLPQTKFGKTTPNSCNFGRQEFGKMCIITCNDGFKIIGPSEKRCMSHGTWNSKFEDTYCIDVVPPKLECPQNITTNTLFGKKYGQVHWQHPHVTDNSGLEVLVWVKPAMNNISDFKFQIGKTPVIYFARDAFHNTAKCRFFVLVEDNEMPLIENCVNPPPFLTGDSNGSNITWEEPYIYDNSQEVKVSKSHQFGHFKMGTTTVTYTAVDGSGNTNICIINITLEETSCESLSTPIFGQTKCNSNDDGIRCIVTCQEGYAISLTETDAEPVNSTSFVCNYTNPVWLHEEELFFPCSVTSFPMSMQNGEISISPENSVCDDSEKFEQLKNVIKSTVNNEICIENCTIDIESECELETDEEVFNIIIRRRRNIFEEVRTRTRNKNKKHKNKIYMKFQIRGKYLNETHSEYQDIRLRNGYNITIRYNKRRYICPVGFVRRKNKCIQCPKGTFQDNATNKCQSCAFGYYNDKLGQTKCFSCPSNYSTNKLHSKNSADCKEVCPPGTYAQRRYFKHSKQYPNKKIGRATLKPYCTLCSVGYYQSEFGQLACTLCPNGFTTTSAGSTSVKQCIPTSSNICSSSVNICNNGTCVTINDYEYTCDCLENSVGMHCEKVVNYCISEPCANGGTCNYLNSTYNCICKEGFAGKFCEDEIIRCNSTCLNNGTCVEASDNEFICLCPIGYGGEQCEIKMNYCNGHPCQNNSTCIQGNDTFKCQCLNGFIGRRCNILPCDYKPCGEFSICINSMKENATENDFSCICPDGFTGKECKIRLNHCQSVPCMNGGSCSSNLSSYYCTCTSLYYGSNCQYERNSNYLLHFQRYDINDYIKLNGFNANITEITACLWIQTSDNFNYGTLISYATKYMDNTFTLTDYSGLVLYVNNNYIVTDVVLNDGHWHHVCTSWQSKEGAYKIYLDGNIVKNGNGLSKDTYIQGNGNMVIGQEQDNLGGKFSLSESFIGKMCYIDIWSKVLELEEILIHFAACNNSLFGTLYAWPEMQDFAYGGVEILKSTFCNKCEEPKLLFNGKVKIIQNIAYYFCDAGYELNTNEYVKGRKCTKATKWEGFYEPYCKKKSCGYPGTVKNGYQIGNGYSFQDRIRYNCYNGFRMIGNSTIICGKDGIWFPKKPQCVGFQCTAFKRPTNSEINIFADQSYQDFTENITMFEIGTQIEVICPSYTETYGENVLTCIGKGTWDSQPPQCMKKEQSLSKSNSTDCSIKQLPTAPNNGYIDIQSLYAVGNGTTHFVEYKCRPGYKLYGDNITTCIIDGYWTQPNTTCRAITCMMPSLLKNMVLMEDMKETYSVGNMISFQCEEGYSMFRNGMITCLPNGKWSKIKGKCIKKSCRKPNLQEGALIQGKSFLYNDTVTIMCSDGSRHKITCNKYGVWEGDTEVC